MNLLVFGLPLWNLSCSTTDSPKSSENWSHGLCNQDTVPTLTAPTMQCSQFKCTIEGGEFLMGSCRHNLTVYPQRVVTLDTFSIDQYEVSILEWKDCMNNGPCSAPATKCDLEHGEHGNGHPITCIDWLQAQEYCEWRGGNLPTEAQWEKAARGTDGRTYPWGNQSPQCQNDNAMFFQTGEGASTARCVLSTVEAQSDSSLSPYGVGHMAGNVYEWILDDYDARYYQRSETENPIGPEDGCYLWQEGWKDDCIYKVIRGGAYNTFQDRSTTFARSFSKPEVRDRNIGFRCVYPE